MTFRAAVPILRSFDEARAKEFYVGFLGFAQVVGHGVHEATDGDVLGADLAVRGVGEDAHTTVPDGLAQPGSWHRA